MKVKLLISKITFELGCWFPEHGILYNFFTDLSVKCDTKGELWKPVTPAREAVLYLD